MAYPTNEKSGAENLVAFALAVRAKIGTGTLTTTAKADLISAINELVTSIGKVKTDLATKSEINDSQSTTTNVWSASKTADSIATAATNVKNDLLNGAGAAYDTLKELGDLIDANKDAIAALQTIAAGHVRFDSAQTLTDAQKKQARDNIGATAAADITTLQGRVSANETGIAAAKAAAATADGKAVKAQGDVDALKTNVGATNIDLEAVFKNGATA